MRQDRRHDRTAAGRPPRNIGSPATRALLGAGYTRLDDLAGVPVAELKKLHGMGPRALERLRAALAERGQSLG
ncbi:helix-hairpin-helix domain-containing protein [Kitasatospora sp. DSM 101779]|uniref:helix-hairpin-helix domain-containing protein n=1 Tax=Kitasatospora sp. DSM 101779 TaxID=2853165 RepID=UPI0021D83F85|nr:helix-hairpin-helix domain-containing protein [Kitasatospora sp. DSM 101779]MCU7826576.1 DNA-binding protein [Kitasatospora sp. DSM 101779]